MFQELKFQLSTAILTILTVAAAVSAGINFSQQFRFHLPDDGVTWVDHAGPNGISTVQAFRVAPDSGADNAGVRTGDILRKINTLPIKKAVYVPQALATIGVWNKADYWVERGGVEFKTSFIFSAFHYTGKLNGFDEVILFGNVAAGLLAPTLFLHFCLTFPEPRPWLNGKLRVVALYLPAAALMIVYIGCSSGVLKVNMPPVLVREMLDRAWMLFLTAIYLTGAAALSFEYRRTEDPIVRQQLKWLRNGAIVGILPFALLYVLPYSLGM